jgi:hypothetical protein
MITFLQRSKYLGYYIMTLEISKFMRFLKYTKRKRKSNSVLILSDILYCVYKYNIGIIDYFVFRFNEKSDGERSEWAGTGFMYEYQSRMNPKSARNILENKIAFLTHFHFFVKRTFFSLYQFKDNLDLAEKLLLNPSGRIVLKGSQGQAGTKVEVISCDAYSPKTLTKYMKKKKYDLAEEYVVQHHSLMELSPSGLNTIRLITQLTQHGVDFLGARLRVSVNSMVDNMAAGNLAALVDIKTGEVRSAAVYSDITKEERTVHPITGKEIKGFVIPHWDKVTELAKKAALHVPDNRSVGWDIAITELGPELIEGNHNWCKFLWQLPAKQGMKRELEKYL